MAETENNPEQITLELIFRQGQRILGELHNVRDKQDETIVRLGRVERETASLRREIAGLHEDWVGLSRRLDNFDHRLERIEQRLDLVEG